MQPHAAFRLTPFRSEADRAFASAADKRSGSTKIRAAAIALATAALCAVSAWALWPMPNPDRHYAFLAKYKDGYAVAINLEGVPFDYACITSYDYGAASLNPKFACRHCRSTAYKRALIGAHYQDHLLLLVHGRSVDVKKIYNMEHGYMADPFLFGAAQTVEPQQGYTFRYDLPQWEWEANSAEGLEQCTSRPIATAECHASDGGCVFLFNENAPGAKR